MSTAASVSDVVVVDASVAVKWFLDEPLAQEARQLLAEWVGGGCRMVAPLLLWLEVANVMRQRLRREDPEVSTQKALASLTLLEHLVAREDAPWLASRALLVAARLQLPAVYDGCYVALAEALGAHFWTADARLYRSTGGHLPWVHCLGETT